MASLGPKWGNSISVGSRSLYTCRGSRNEKNGPSTLRELIADALLEALNHEAMGMPTFLLVDKVLTSDEACFDEESKSLHQEGDLRMFLSDTEYS